MTYAWFRWREEIAQFLSERFGKIVDPSELQQPPDAELGDFAWGCFRMARDVGKTPEVVARDFVQNFSSSGLPDCVESLRADGPYINVRIARELLVRTVLDEIVQQGSAYGSKVCSSTGTLLFEYANPNTHKEFHVGHVRNIVLGNALQRIWTHAGMQVVPISYVNDVGKNVAMCVYQLIRSCGFDPRTLTREEADACVANIPGENRNGAWLGTLYAEATRTAKENEVTRGEILWVHHALEKQQPVIVRVWQETTAWSLTELRTMLEELNATYTEQIRESELLERSGEIVEDLLRLGIAKESQGAVIVDLEPEGMGVLVLRTQERTLLYSAKDLALAERKRNTYPDVIRSVTLVDVRQCLYFKQLAAILHRMGHHASYEALGYEIVTLPEGTMSSRKGNIVTYCSLRDALIARASEEVKQRHADWPTARVTDVVQALARAALVFGMVKQDPDKVITFDLKSALAFEGATASYCAYALTRLHSILRQAPDSVLVLGDMSCADFVPSEHALLLVLARFPERVRCAASTNRPSVLAEWTLDCARCVHDFYRDAPVLKVASVSIQSRRIRLCRAASQVLEEGLMLIGVPTTDEM